MRSTFLATGAAALALGLLPLSAFAATTDPTLSEAEVLDFIEESPAKEMGGDMYYPGPYGGISVDVSVTKEVTPDYIAVSGYCEVTNVESRDDVRTQLTKLYTDVKADVGTDGRVRRGGSASIYPYYDYSTGNQTGNYSGSVNIFIRVLRIEAAQRISDILDDHACSPSWDVRLVDTEQFETNVLDSLISKVNNRKKVFEKLLGKKLSNVTGVSLSTWVDGYSSYDPESNTADATTTLSITFDVGTTVLPKPTTRAPRG